MNAWLQMCLITFLLSSVFASLELENTYYINIYIYMCVCVNAFYGKHDIWIKTMRNKDILPKVFMNDRSIELWLFLSR